MTKNIISIRGMHCVSCSAIITKKISALDHVHSVSVNYANETASLEYNETQTSLNVINESIQPLGYTLVIDDHKHDHHQSDAFDRDVELYALRNQVEFSLPVTLIMFVLMMWDILAGRISSIPNMPLPMHMLDTLSMILATVVLFWIGKPYISGVVRFFKHRVANMDTLIGLGTLVAYLYSTAITLFPNFREAFQLSEYTYFDVTIVVIGFVTLGKYLEARSKQKTGDAIQKLLNLQAKTALVIRDGREYEIPIDQVVRDDILIVKPAGRIPVDGIVVDGHSYVDESMITGEPMPVKKQEGDTVGAGTLNTSGTFTFRATKVGDQTLLAHIVRMVQEAQGSRAPIQALADKISAVFVPVVLIIAVITLGAWLSIGTFYLGFSQALSYALVSCVGVLIIACPCALGLATPTAIIVGVGRGAREGILIKDAATLQKLHTVDTVVVDKTGTLTIGKPELVSIQNFSEVSDDGLLALLAGLESKSEHPLAHAIVSRSQERNIEIVPVKDFSAIEGKGVKGIINDVEYFAGNSTLMHDVGISFDAESIASHTLEGKTPILFATSEELLGIFMIADSIKPEAIQAVKQLHQLGIRVIMLTGDTSNTAQYVADHIGIDEVVAQMMPDQKREKIIELQKNGRIVAMSGDGVNDAPALAQADVGIAMATGTDVAIETAGITLLHGDISKLVKAIRLSKMTMRGIKQNLFWAFIYNSIGIPLASGVFFPWFGWLLSPVFAGFAMAMSSVSVVGNSLRIKSKKL